MHSHNAFEMDLKEMKRLLRLVKHNAYVTELLCAFSATVHTKAHFCFVWGCAPAAEVKHPLVWNSFLHTMLLFCLCTGEIKPVRLSCMLLCFDSCRNRYCIVLSRHHISFSALCTDEVYLFSLIILCTTVCHLYVLVTLTWHIMSDYL